MRLFPLVIVVTAAAILLENNGCICSAFAPPLSYVGRQQHQQPQIIVQNDHHDHQQRQPSLLLYRSPTTIRLPMSFNSAGGGEDDDYDDDIARIRKHNDARTDVRNLLTQRAIQSFLYLSEQLRDPHSGKWIEDFLDGQNMLHYHGTGAAYLERFGNTWEGPLLAMIDRPKDVVVVSAKRSGKGHRGWSKNNPYLEDRYVEFNIDIDPVSLATRILSVREQIAKEFVTDLDVLKSANERILDSYFALAKEERTKKDDELTTTPPSSFERTATVLINEHTAFQTAASSPFRKGNFDLLYNICTQASVHRVLRKLKEAGSEEDIAFSWLRQFYSDCVAEYFDGDQKYGRADDFMDDLLSAPPSFIETDSGRTGLADPMALAEDIIATRSQIAEEWKEIVGNVPQDHIDVIRPILLSKQMAAWGQSNNSPLGGGGEGGGGDASGSFQ